MNDNSDHYTQNYMISFERALELITQHSEPLSDEVIPLEDYNGRILSTDILSPISVPSFDNSAMDGYAVNSADLSDACQDSPVVLNLIGLAAAGDSISEPMIRPGDAWKIMTGAPVPKGFDAIIPIENTSLDDSKSHISCFSVPNKSAHIRSSGEDFLKGALVLKKYCLLNSNRIMALSSLGIAEVSAIKKPKIAVFSTGKELIDDISLKLKSGQIYNSNMPYILNYLQSLPVDSFNAGTNYDDVEAYQEALSKQLNDNVDIIISTGAVSMGDFDFIPQTILKMGGEIIFHKIKIRPGKPLLFAIFPNGSYYFGLPGNPISATIGLRFFVSHLITKLLGLGTEKPSVAHLQNDASATNDSRKILKANQSVDQKGRYQVNILNGQESFKINSMIDANSWVILPENSENKCKDDLVQVYPSNIILD